MRGYSYLQDTFNREPVHPLGRASSIRPWLVLLLCFLLAVLLTGCDYSKTAEPDAQAKLADGQVVRVATAPDGTVLWAVRVAGAPVYFSSSGTHYEERHGKTSLQREVPNWQTTESVERLPAAYSQDTEQQEQLAKQLEQRRQQVEDQNWLKALMFTVVGMWVFFVVALMLGLFGPWRFPRSEE